MTAFCENGQLHVVLSEVETVKYNIDNILFSRESQKADKALIALLKMAVSETGFKTKATKFLIEIYPVINGGCEIYFIPDLEVKSRVQVVAKKTQPKFLTIEFDDSESMFLAIEVLYQSPRTRYAKSSLFEYNQKYRLIVAFWDKNDYEDVLLCGFAKKILSKDYDCVKTREYGKVLCSDTAVFTIGKAICKSIKGS